MLRRLTKIAMVLVAILFVAFSVAFATLPAPGTVPVLMYHFIDTPERAREEKNVVSKSSFAFQMAFLRIFRYRVISMEELYEIKTGKRTPQGRELLITFDDGNYTFETNAYPILVPHQIPVTLFVVSESVKRESEGSMSAQTLKRLLKNDWITVASHSKTHPSLPAMPEDQIEEELAGSKEDLEEMLQTPIHYLSYPNGDLDGRVIEIARRSGYRLAFTTAYKKLQGLEEGMHSLSRVKISRTSDNPLVFWFKISGLYQLAKRERARIKMGRKNIPQLLEEK